MRNTACTYHATLGLNVRIRYVCLCVCDVMYCVYPYVRLWRRHWLQQMWHGRRMKRLRLVVNATTVIAWRFKGESLKEKESRSKR